MKKAGSLSFFDNGDILEIYTDNFKEFYTNENILLNQEDLEMWSEWLNSPWSQEHEKYIIELNCIDAYTPMDKKEPSYRAYYQIVGYEGITAVVYGYGNTPQESLQDCMNHFEYLQKEYNKENVSM